MFKNISKKCLQIFVLNFKNISKKLKKFPKNVKKIFKKSVAEDFIRQKIIVMAKSQFFGFNIIFIINFHYLESLEIMKFRI